MQPFKLIFSDNLGPGFKTGWEKLGIVIGQTLLIMVMTIMMIIGIYLVIFGAVFAFAGIGTTLLDVMDDSGFSNEAMDFLTGAAISSGLGIAFLIAGFAMAILGFIFTIQWSLGANRTWMKIARNEPAEFKTMFEKTGLFWNYFLFLIVFSIGTAILTPVIGITMGLGMYVLMPIQMFALFALIDGEKNVFQTIGKGIKINFTGNVWLAMGVFCLAYTAAASVVSTVMALFMYIPILGWIIALGLMGGTIYLAFVFIIISVRVNDKVKEFKELTPAP